MPSGQENGSDHEGLDPPASGATSWWRRRRLECTLFMLVFCGFAYFYNGFNWNQISRYDSIFSMVEPGTPDSGTFRIDHFLPDPDRGSNTGDWARNLEHGAHYYSNKAPGPALMGVVPYWLLYRLERSLGFAPERHLPTLVNTYLLNLLLTVLPAALAAVAFFHLLQLASEDRRTALFLTLALFFGTMIFPYSTQLWAHTGAAAFIILSVYCWLAPNRRLIFWAGLWVGLATLTEYSGAIVVAGLLLVLLWARDWRRLGLFVLGGLIPFICFVGYHKVCFGSYFTVANLHNNPHFLSPDHAGGIFGFLQIEALWGLTFSVYRGLFFHTPFLALVLPACFLLRGRMRPRLHFLCLFSVIGFFLMNLAFNGWHGGACVGPRYLIPSLPFYVLLLAPFRQWLHERLPRPAVWALLACLLVPSVANMLVAASVSPMGDARRTGVWANPLGLYYLSLRRSLQAPPTLPPNGFLTPHGHVPIRVDSDAPPGVRRYAGFNLGELAGLPERWSLLPWLALVAMTCWALWRWTPPGRDP